MSTPRNHDWLDDAHAGPWQIIHDHEFGYVAFARVRTYDGRADGIEFGITEHVSGDGAERMYGTSLDSRDTDPFAADLACAGWIKWDGCSHLWWGERSPRDGYIHVCGADSWTDLLTALAAVRAFAAANVPTFEENA